MIHQVGTQKRTELEVYLHSFIAASVVSVCSSVSPVLGNELPEQHVQIAITMQIFSNKFNLLLNYPPFFMVHMIALLH